MHAEIKKKKTFKILKYYILDCILFFLKNIEMTTYWIDLSQP